mgnify:CR=1 FL=1
MKKEYDFHNAEQGKFHRPQDELETPVYLDKNVSSFFQEVARKKDIDVATLVNQVLEKEISIQKTMS